MKFFEERRRLIEAFYNDTLPYTEVLEGKRDSMDIVKAKIVDVFLEDIKDLKLETSRQTKGQELNKNRAIDFTKLVKDQVMPRSLLK
ncbi:hypothetical protein [Prochlorococcus sp. MIT 1201]|uniref:hypothetical protein n=1 Tax=Prochlorococcus sp. MIT 1201 TaxID=3082535 RepID=UPI0039A6F8E5